MGDIQSFYNWFNTLPLEMRLKMNANDMLLSWLARSAEIGRLKNTIRKLKEGESDAAQV